MRKFINKVTLGAVAVAALTLSACMSSGSNPASSEEGYATVTVTAKTKGVSALSKPGLGKASAITLDRLVITAISDAASPLADDTVIVTLNIGDSGLVASTASNQTLTGVPLTLKALRSWTITVLTFDAADDTIQASAEENLGQVYAGEKKPLTIQVDPLYSSYKAKFNLPATISSGTGNFTQTLTVSKIEMFTIKGIDTTSVVSKNSPSLVDSLEYDKLKLSEGITHLLLRVYGTLPEASAPWLTDTVLYSGVALLSGLDADAPTPVSLAWKGPTVGEADLKIELGKVGLYVITAGTEPQVLPKK